jgi:hypothetical protein
MSIEKHYTTTFTVQRMEWSGDSSGLATQGTISGHLQQARPEMAEAIGLRWTAVYTIWCDIDADVEVGDRLTEEDNVYSVRAIQKNNVGQNKHLELVIEKHE